MEEMNFEDAMRRLEEIFGKLEQGDVSLNDSMTLFTEGTGLIRRCTELLDKAEQQVVVLTAGPDGSPQEKPFQAEEA